MLVFPNCKINLGLHVVARRPDGYHTIETVFYPVSWCDGLEVIGNKDSDEAFVFSQSGLSVEGATEHNLVYKAWQMIAGEKDLPPLKVHLHKNLPMGAGLGGGSSDAAYFINLLNQKFGLGYSEAERMTLASRLGSDCAFFIRNSPVFATGRGDEFSEIGLRLDHCYILIVHPGIHSQTKEAYAGLSPRQPALDLREVLRQDMSLWKDSLVNDFEETILARYPAIRALKDYLYEQGALYASMSGSGSAVFGLFSREPELRLPEGYRSYLQKPGQKFGRS
jgi:4-diphosphocytidyl-2-C-methyl-D-erythritol kinase